MGPKYDRNRFTHIRDSADAMPHAVPRTAGICQYSLHSMQTGAVPFVPKISGVHPYKTAHIACQTGRQISEQRKTGGAGHTVALKLMPTVLARTAHGCSTMTKTQQKNAVTKVLPARDHRRPRGDSISQAPNYNRDERRQ